MACTVDAIARGPAAERGPPRDRRYCRTGCRTCTSPSTSAARSWPPASSTRAAPSSSATGSPPRTRDVWSALARLVKRVRRRVAGAAGGVRCRMRRADGARQGRGVAAVHPVVARVRAARPARRADRAADGRRHRGQGDRARARRGAAPVAGVDDFIGVVVATGVSGGIISGGRLLQGRVGNAGHIGHMVVEADGRPCVCGGFGCLDAYCSRPGDRGGDRARRRSAPRGRSSSAPGRWSGGRSCRSARSST